MILNDSYEKKKEWSYIAKLGESVIDYTIANADAEEEMLMVDEGEREDTIQEGKVENEQYLEKKKEYKDWYRKKEERQEGKRK